MKARSPIGRFRSDRAAQRYFTGYDAVIRDWPVPLEPLDVPTGYGTTRLYRTGAAEGLPVMFLPGMGGNSLGWIHACGPVGARHPVYLVDPLGTAGRSHQTAPLRDTKDLAHWIREVLDGIGVPHVYLVGFSYGGYMSLVQGIHTPERVAGMTLLDPAAFRVAGFSHYAWGIGCGIGMLLPPLLRRPLAKLLYSDSINRAEDVKVAITGTYLYEGGQPAMVPLTDDELGAVTAPTRILFGKHSTMQDSAAVARRLSQVLPAAEVELVPGTGHAIALDVPDLVNERILEHAAGVTAGP
ncbi:alpha/beta fold hydrolase [Nonomuraea sp. NEAU-A123]|uniref:alpha/beta fold hydrolase n=1 Tax=Nonomuraea sp. NEAU-A123 TaxID=2839649 RepID=UPI001BE4D852|nr:alpha/beta hydrolase [Nonomuraea sp. NEAU-A123]MBT2232633.1 alpha/beta hydrolase [Nonomuraea sp. NEAU-A123]